MCHSVKKFSPTSKRFQNKKKIQQRFLEADGIGMRTKLREPVTLLGLLLVGKQIVFTFVMVIVIVAV